VENIWASDGRSKRKLGKNEQRGASRSVHLGKYDDQIKGKEMDGNVECMRQK